MQTSPSRSPGSGGSGLGETDLGTPNDTPARWDARGVVDGHACIIFQTYARHNSRSVAAPVRTSARPSSTCRLGQDLADSVHRYRFNDHYVPHSVGPEPTLLDLRLRQDLAARFPRCRRRVRSSSSLRSDLSRPSSVSRLEQDLASSVPAA